jgi:hypothetical protein
MLGALHMSTSSLDHDTVLRAVQQWPRSAQVELAHEILRAAERQREQHQPNAPLQDSWQRLIGFLATDQPAPSDEEIERWREERRIEKYER